MRLLVALVILLASSNEANMIDRGREYQEPLQPFQPIDANSDVKVIGEVMELSELVTEVPETEEGVLDSFLGEGAQTRIVSGINNWIVERAKTNPGCVERFVCETYKTGETFEGIPYFLMTLTNAAVSFMVAEMFDKSVDINEITKAARYGRTMGTCHTMKCDFMDNQLRTVTDYLGGFEDLFSSIFNSLSNSISIGK